MISGQSDSRSKSRSRRFVRNRTVFEGPSRGCAAGIGPDLSACGAGARRLRDRARDVLMVVIDMLITRFGFRVTPASLYSCQW